MDSARVHSPEAVFIFTSTNKVYGAVPNRLPLVEQTERWEIEPGHDYELGIREDMAIDQSLHNVFGSSKVAAVVMVQEYGRYFGMKTVCFRGGCLTDPGHSGAALHGFLAYLMRCAVSGMPYQVFGYKGKQVRDNIHCDDPIRGFHEFFKAPRAGEVYNLGGNRFSNWSMREAIRLCEGIAGRPLNRTYVDACRVGDHIRRVSDVRKFRGHYPGWSQRFDVPALLRDIYEANEEGWRREAA